MLLFANVSLVFDGHQTDLRVVIAGSHCWLKLLLESTMWLDVMKEHVSSPGVKDCTVMLYVVLYLRYRYWAQGWDSGPFTMRIFLNEVVDKISSYTTQGGCWKRLK